ncbi:hypothetical protein [uncultured Alistipes sp.]|jgi:glycerophosphodiester phosphodiesterase|uniref:hypothetical protein n=1 Tax=uncultured Alistipes sp. TaxID=538949 RepID=UPI0025EE1EAC|nr:hypothetical protein [uncultured Alistipes sp.]
MPDVRVFHLNGDHMPSELKEQGYAGLDYSNIIIADHETNRLSMLSGNVHLRLSVKK